MSEGDPRFEPPDAATLAWAARQLESDAVVVVRRLGGGLDAATHLVRSNEGTEAVLRRAARPHDGLRGEEFRMERDQLTKLQDTGLPMAVPLGADLHAVHTDVPALLVSRLPGRLTYPREPTAAFISALAQAAAMVHGQPVPDPVWPWHDRAAKLQRSVEAGQGPAWARLRESGIPQGPLTFVHGDLWPGNLLFHDDLLAGIVDWGDAGVGHPALEVTYMAADLRVATGSQDAHAALIDVYEELRGPLTNRDGGRWRDICASPPTQPTGWPAGRRPAYRSARPACEPVTPSDWPTPGTG